MEYFFYCRDKAGTALLRAQTAEAHWSFMDSYAEAMIARGPTLTARRRPAACTWSTLPDAAAARVFAFDEPNYRAGVYREVLVRHWRNALGRTMWDYAGDQANNQRFLIIGHARPGRRRAGLLEQHRHYFVDRGYQDRFIARGPLLSDDGTDWLGSAMLVELADRTAVEAMLADEPHVRAGLYTNVEIHRWRFGGAAPGRRAAEG